VSPSRVGASAVAADQWRLLLGLGLQLHDQETVSIAQHPNVFDMLQGVVVVQGFAYRT
jgi:hypothetical protein